MDVPVASALPAFAILVNGFPRYELETLSVVWRRRRLDLRKESREDGNGEEDQKTGMGIERRQQRKVISVLHNEVHATRLRIARQENKERRTSTSLRCPAYTRWQDVRSVDHSLAVRSLLAVAK